MKNQLYLLTSIFFCTIASCDNNPPSLSQNNSNSDDEIGSTIWNFGSAFPYETHEFCFKNGDWKAVKKIHDGKEVLFVRVTPVIDSQYTSQTFDIPINNAKAMVKFIEWAKQQKITNPTTKQSSLVFQPLPDSYWIRRSLPSGDWHDGTPSSRFVHGGYVRNFEIDGFLTALRKAIMESDKL